MASFMENTVNNVEEYLLSREERVTQIRNLVETLRAAEEVAKQGYLITSS